MGMKSTKKKKNANYKDASLQPSAEARYSGEK